MEKFNIRWSKKKSIIFAIAGFNYLYLVLYESNWVLVSGVERLDLVLKKHFRQFCNWLTHFLFDKGKNASQTAENINSVYGSDAETANYSQFWFRFFGLISMLKTYAHLMANCRKWRQNHGFQLSSNSNSIAQELKTVQKSVWHHLNRPGQKKSLINGCHTKTYWTKFSFANYTWIARKTSHFWNG